MSDYTAKQIETGVIASLLDDSTLYEEVKHLIKPEMFESKFHESIAKNLKNRSKQGLTWDAVVVANSVNSEERQADIYQLAGEIQTQAIFFEYFKVFHLNYFWRDLFKSIKDERETDVFSLKTFIDDHLTIGSDDNKERTFEDIAITAGERVANAGERKLEMPTNFKTLDGNIGGFHRKQITLLVGATGHAKSLFAWNMLMSPLMLGFKVIVYDYEMTEESLITRLVAMYYRVPLDWMQSGKHHTDGKKITNDERAEMIKFFGIVVDKVKSNLIIKTHSKLDQIEADMKANRPDIVLIDTIQAFCKKHKKENGVNNADHITDICSAINRIAKENNCAILQTAQVNRATDGNVPTEANIKESSGIADNAAVIIGVRDREKGEDAKEEDAGMFDLYISKNRHGKIGRFVFQLNKAIAHVGEWAQAKSLEQERKVQI